MRIAPTVTITEAQTRQLQAWARGRSIEVRLAQRAQMRIGDVACKRHPQKAHERQAVCNLVLQAFVRQAIESLQDEHFEHEDATGWFASSVALAHFGIQAFKDGTKYLPVDNLVEPLQRVTCLAQARVAILKVKEAVLHAAPVSFGVSFYNVLGQINDDKNSGEFIEVPCTASNYLDTL